MYTNLVTRAPRANAREAQSGLYIGISTNRSGIVVGCIAHGHTHVFCKNVDDLPQQQQRMHYQFDCKNPKWEIHNDFRQFANVESHPLALQNPEDHRKLLDGSHQQHMLHGESRHKQTSGTAMHHSMPRLASVWRNILGRNCQIFLVTQCVLVHGANAATRVQGRTLRGSRMPLYRHPQSTNLRPRQPPQRLCLQTSSSWNRAAHVPAAMNKLSTRLVSAVTMPPRMDVERHKLEEVTRSS